MRKKLERKDGHWILKDDGKLYCSQCGAVLPFVTHLKFGMSGTYTTDTNIEPTPFCPSCGAEMEETDIYRDVAME